MDEFDLARRLRWMRLGYGLSQRALARRAGVAHATISLIESGRMNPSVGALKRVLDGIPIGLSEFFSLNSLSQRQYFFRREDLLEIGRGGISYRQVGKSMNGHSLQILSERYEPGADTGRILLAHEGEEGAVIVRGRLEVTVGNTKRVLSPGEAYAFPSKIPHRFHNIGSEACELISACTPPSF